MTDSGQRGIIPAENVAASEPTGSEHATHAPDQWAYCALCRFITSEPVFIGSVEQMSGPGIALYADPECALRYAGTEQAPEWLREQYAAEAV